MKILVTGANGFVGKNLTERYFIFVRKIDSCTWEGGEYQLCNWCMTSCTTGTARVAQLVYAALGRCSHGLSDRLHVPLYERYQKTK